MTKVAVGLVLSGNTKTYYYSCDAAEAQGRVPGTDRAVVPNKLKGDGTLSLSIGTFVEVDTQQDPSTLEPLVQFLDSRRLFEARARALDTLAATAESPRA